jgi:hypothetical protein
MSLRVLRGTRAVAISLVALLFIAFAVIQYKQHLIRGRMERLLADFHSIRLNETTWPEAQALMRRWGDAGHAHGACNSTDCAYDITVVGWPSLLPDGRAAPWLYRWGGRFPLLLERVGVRFSVLDLRFLVEDGTVRRTHLNVTAETGDASQISLLLVAVISRSTLSHASPGSSGSDESPNMVGADEELGAHPNFVVGADGFCSGCETISLAFTPQIAQDELVRLTSFDLSCLTRVWPCSQLSELAPALMRADAANLRDVPRNSVHCTTPAWALARDAGVIWLVDTLDTSQVLDPNPPYGEAASLVEQDQVRLVKTLRGVSRIPAQTILLFRPYSGVEYEARAVPEHLAKGHRYIVFPSPAGDWVKDGAEAWRCGVIEDTPANELSVKRGIAVDDHLRAPELTGAWPW